MANLPSDLLQVIAGGLENPLDVTRFRSVCRSWRLSVQLFPLRIPLLSMKGIHPEPQLLAGRMQLAATTVYLLRHPSKSWMVSVQESEKAGKLLLRHPLTYGQITNALRLSEWSATQIARSHQICSSSSYFPTTSLKAVFISSHDCGESVAAMAVYSPGLRIKMCAFRLLSDGTAATQFIEGDPIYSGIEDFVSFKGRVYVVDKEAYVYMIDSKALQLLPMRCSNLFPKSIRDQYYIYCTRFVVSDGDLYMVLTTSCRLGECMIYKLVIMDGTDGATCSYSVERVEDLGDRVFFINRDCSFVVSAGDLPHPWEGNCVVLHKHCFGELYHRYICDEDDVRVYRFGGVDQLDSQCSLMSSLHGYSDLFANQSKRHKKLEKKKKKRREREREIKKDASCIELSKRRCLKMQTTT